MKKHGCLNSEISTILSKLGHTDLIMIADCGLPIPDGVKRIDLALKPGDPKFIDVLEVVLRDMTCEKYFLANEITTNNLECEKMDDVHVIGFDATDDAKTSIKAGEMDATVEQQPKLMGQTAIETAVKIANGETAEATIPVDVTLVTSENVEA